MGPYPLDQLVQSPVLTDVEDSPALHRPKIPVSQLLVPGTRSPPWLLAKPTLVWANKNEA
eukprot:2325598-Lingulodinium_polyedra.AAC.1